MKRHQIIDTKQWIETVDIFYVESTYIYLFDMIFFSYVEYWMQQRLEILENLVSRTIGESSTQNLARQLQTHGACTHCAKVQRYEQGKIGL